MFFKKMTVNALFLSLLAATLFFGCGKSEPKQAAVPEKTLANLQAAFNGESNAHARYLMFAQKANQDGYLGVEQLFLAAAKAEQIHAEGHARVIEKLGARPAADIKSPEVKSTLENLQAALQGETYEKDSMYPGFVAQAAADNNPDAQRTFRGALAAEREHAKLYADAIANLDAWKSVSKTIIVCTVCGFTTTDLSLVKCPVCANPRNKFIEFK